MYSVKSGVSYNLNLGCDRQMDRPT